MSNDVLAVLRREDFAWRTKFCNELRAQGVSGSNIGAALNETDQFCIDSGQWHQQAFGDPVEYANELGLATEAFDVRAALSEVPLAAQMLGFFLVIFSLPGLIGSAGVAIQWSSFAIPVIYLLAAISRSDQLRQRRLRTARIWLVVASLGFAAVSIVVGFFPLALGPEAFYRVPALLFVLVGAALLFGGALWTRNWDKRREPITSPLDSPSTRQQALRGVRWQRLFRTWGCIALTLAVLAFFAILTSS